MIGFPVGGNRLNSPKRRTSFRAGGAVRMRSLAVVGFFILSLIGLGTALRAQAEDDRPRVDPSLARPTRLDAGSPNPNRGRPGEDDSDEEQEEDVQSGRSVQ
jgi:hypothetical protein